MDLTEIKAKKIWQGVLQDLKKELEEGDFKLWLEPIRFEYKENRIILCGPDPYFCSWLRDNYLAAIKAALEKTLLANVELKISVYREPAGQQLIEADTPAPFCSLVKLHEDLKAVATKPEQLTLKGFLPTRLCRSTFFRPVPRKSLGPAGLAYDHPPIDTKWAILVWHGPDCGIQEEDVLIWLVNRWVKAGQQPFGCTYAEILDGVGYKRDKNGKHENKNRRNIKEHIDRLSKVSFLLTIKNGPPDQNSGGRFHVLKYSWDAKGITIVIDPEFGRLIASGYITGLQGRELLSKDTSKALHRFMCSHRGLDGHFPVIDVAQAINMDLTNSSKVIEQMLRKAILELKKIGFLTAQSQIKDSKIHWYRTGLVLSGPKLLEEIKK